MRHSSLIPRFLPALVLLTLLGCRKAEVPTPLTSAPQPSPPRGDVTTSAPQGTAPVTQEISEGPLFDLKIEPSDLPLARGGKAKLKITVDRIHYDGPIAVELRPLPAGVTAQKALFIQSDKTLEIEVQAKAKARSGTATNVQAVGTAVEAANQQVASEKFTISVVVGESIRAAPFDLQVDPGTLQLSQGGQAKIKVTAVRKDYQGPIAVELQNLPAGVEAPKGLIPKGGDEVDMELSAAAKAAEGRRDDVTVLGTGTQADHPQGASAPIILTVQGVHFDLTVAANSLRLKPGGKVRVAVLAARKGYDGPISVALRNLPPHVTAHPETIPSGQSRVEIELEADVKASPVEKTDVHALGTATAAGNKQATSPDFTVEVEHGRKAVSSFELKVEESVVHLHPGGKAKVRVQAIRKNYTGPIVVELRDLPAHVKAPKATLGPDQGTVEVEVEADARSAGEERGDVYARGAGEHHESDSAHFKVIVGKKP